jgi:hypothetical protein
MKSIIVFLAGMSLLIILPFNGAEWLGRVLITVGLVTMTIGWIVGLKGKL